MRTNRLSFLLFVLAASSHAGFTAPEAYSTGVIPDADPLAAADFNNEGMSHFLNVGTGTGSQGPRLSSAPGNCDGTFRLPIVRRRQGTSKAR